MMQFFGRLMKLPLEAFVYSMEMLVHTMRGIQQITNRGIDMMAELPVQPPVEASVDKNAVPGITQTMPEATHAVPEEEAGEGGTEASQTNQGEERHMADKDLRDDMLKLVRYKVLFVKRDYEHAFKEEEELVADNTDASAYTAWKIAQFIQRLNKDRDIELPKGWGDDFPGSDYYVTRDNRRWLTGFPEDDKKYLRIFYEVLERYTRERFRYEEEQIDILRDISRTLRGGTPTRTSSPSTGTTGTTPPPTGTTGTTRP